MRDVAVTGVQTCALPIYDVAAALRADASVAAVERNAIAWSHVAGAPRSTAATTTSTDSFPVYQGWHYGLIDLPRAWDLTDRKKVGEGKKGEFGGARTIKK